MCILGILEREREGGRRGWVKGRAGIRSELKKRRGKMRGHVKSFCNLDIMECCR